VGPQEYTIIMMKAVEPLKPALKFEIILYPRVSFRSINNSTIYFFTATLRQERVFAQLWPQKTSVLGRAAPGSRSVVKSPSDAMICMAYYTVAHLMQPDSRAN